MIKENILKIKERISLICSRINRQPNSIIIVCVTKGRSLEQIKEAIDAGITDIGENKVQEAVAKYNELRTGEWFGKLTIPRTIPSAVEGPANRRTIKWHMVGHLQTNKVKDAVRIFDLIQSVDSIRLAKEIDRQAAKINKIQDILIEIKTSPEESKFGIRVDDAIEVIKDIVKFKNININGLMTIAPIVDNPQRTRPYFRLLRELQDKINDLRLATCDLRLLSMGMTDDFEVAIEECSNMVRLGRAIFEG